ncbi:MAG: hypothetical protein JNJ71_14675 [Rubrivivax sp.]|nr:hypothetical protein [Rubrivivax sp.]
MSLSLRSVPAAQGSRWMRDGFRLFGKHPLAFSLMLVVFWAAAILVSAIPFLGSAVVLAAVPLLGLGFMVAAESALNKGPIHPGQFLTPLRKSPAQRKSLLILCVMFGIGTGLVWWIAHLIDGGSFAQLNRLMAAEGSEQQMRALVETAEFQQGLVVRLVLLVLLSIPFWHAPALVHWGGQGPGQALFSSTLAMWRNRGACVVYVLSWFAIMLLFGIVITLAFGLLGMGQMTALMSVPAGLIFSTVFYASLIFTFNDSFGGSGIRSNDP